MGGVGRGGAEHDGGEGRFEGGIMAPPWGRQRKGHVSPLICDWFLRRWLPWTSLTYNVVIDENRENRFESLLVQSDECVDNLLLARKYRKSHGNVKGVSRNLCIVYCEVS